MLHNVVGYNQSYPDIWYEHETQKTGIGHTEVTSSAERTYYQISNPTWISICACTSSIKRCWSVLQRLTVPLLIRWRHQIIRLKVPATITPLLLAFLPYVDWYRGEEYKVLWPEKAEFVRLAAASGAIIVPFSAVGIADRYVCVRVCVKSLNTWGGSRYRPSGLSI